MKVLLAQVSAPSKPLAYNSAVAELGPRAKEKRQFLSVYKHRAAPAAKEKA